MIPHRRFVKLKIVGQTDLFPRSATNVSHCTSEGPNVKISHFVVDMLSPVFAESEELIAYRTGLFNIRHEMLHKREVQ